MHFPCLVEKRFCNTEITLEVEQEGYDNYGDPLESYRVSTKCNYQDSAKTVLTAEKRLIQLEGCALIPGDPLPQVKEISSGYITVLGEKRTIYKGRKHRNPDQTVNFTEIQVI